ncbi:RDD family protein [Candidatus Ozemobacteraceae bacterium]|nr:RDD family protein [Candidatus Ozemobacteraceae bacterium]
MGKDIKSQNLSIMMTDIQGYSTTAATSSRNEIISLIRRHNQLMVPVIEFYGGKVIKSIGDAFLCTFVSATDAVICSIIIQLLLREYNARQKNETQKLNLRVVVHSGDVSIEGNDIFGDAVNVTARIEGLPCFPGGSIGISEITYMLMDKNEIAVEKLGPQTLKGIPNPVTVYSVPLEKQKLTTLPTHLLELVEKVVAGRTESSGIAASTAEWQKSIVKFLQEKNWGDNLGKVQKQIGQNIGQVQTKLVQTFGQKTILEQGKGKTLTDASLRVRMKCFIIDMMILTFLAVILQVGWWPVHRIVYGAKSIESQAFNQLESDDQKRYTYDYESSNYRRISGTLEWAIDLNVRIPIIPFILYFTLFWGLKGASPGQIAGHSAVIMSSGQPPTFPEAFKRAAIFVLTLLPFGIGGLAIFVGTKETLWDKFCSSRVVE